MSKRKLTRTKLLQSGERFGRYVVLGFAENRYNGVAFWRVVCDCGNRRSVQGSNLRSGKSNSCGCIRTEGRTKHGMEGTRTYNTWAAMKYRCTKVGSRNWDNYGGRGIDVCKRWLSFENFYADMGDQPEGLSLDRIDNNGNYEPGNCRWATWSEQNSNRRPPRLNPTQRKSVGERLLSARRSKPNVN